jgi:hypothetical protein
MSTRVGKAILCIAALTLLSLSSVGSQGQEGKPKTDRHGFTPSDPMMTGTRDLNYDHLIVAGDRIGPAQVGGSIRDALKHLGNPNSAGRFYDNIGHQPDRVSYYFNAECIIVNWDDTGLDPKITEITVTCDKWRTSDGLQVGTAMSELSSHFSQYCPMQYTSKDHRFAIYTKQGIYFIGKNRNSPMYEIHVTPARDSFMPMCRD